jgi:ribose transport system substrate-binding protein
MKEVLRDIGDVPVFFLNGDGRFGPSLEIVRKHLRERDSRRTLVGTINDPSALGALRAFEECGRSQDCAVVGQNASPEARCEMKLPGTRLIGSVAYFAEKYGDCLIQLAIRILTHQPVPPAVFVKHHLITPENLSHFYPNDALLAAAL